MVEKLYMIIGLVFLLVNASLGQNLTVKNRNVDQPDDLHSTYSNINDKGWGEIITENNYKWIPPYTVHLPIQPVHSPHLVHVDRALNVSKRYVTKDVRVEDRALFNAASTQETWIVQFAFENPAMVPDFQLSTLSLYENQFPVVKGDYYSRDLYYEIEYKVKPLNEGKGLLWMDVKVTNEADYDQVAHVRTKVHFQPEHYLFHYHYVPFYWDASRWLKGKGVKLDGLKIYRGEDIIGKVDPGSMEVEWEDEAQFGDEEYNLYLRTTRYSGFVKPHLRLKSVDNVIYAKGTLEPGETKQFSVTILVDTENITDHDLDILETATSESVCNHALDHFREQFGNDITKIDFKHDNWEGVLTELQLSALQLLIRYPGENNLLPTQGGSSERFFVWVWEAVHMLKPLLRLGHFEAVKGGLDYIFSLQDAGVPPKGDFTTTEGAVGTTGPKWANTTGSALFLASRYYQYSKDDTFLDQYLPRLLKAGHWITGEIQSTRKLREDGVRPLYYGIMPYAVGTDGDEGYVVSFTDAYTFLGLNELVFLLEKVNHKEAHYFRKELDQYRNDLQITIEGLRHPSGFIDRVIQPDGKEAVYERKFENVDAMATLVPTGVIEPSTEVFQDFIRYFEENRANGYFMGEMDREIVYIGLPEFLWQHIYLRLGEWKKAFAAMQTNFMYGMTQDTYQTQERFSRRDPAFTCWQPNGSGNGRMIDMMLNSIYFETENEVTLLGGIPFEWLERNQTISLKNLYTIHGAVDLEVIPADEKSFLVRLSSKTDPLPEHLRFPDFMEVHPVDHRIKNRGAGRFALESDLREVEFIIKKDGN